MPFKGILKELTSNAHAQGAILLDWEGEAVDSYSASDSLELAAIGAHKGIILNLLRDATARLDSTGGEIESVGISTESSKLAITVIKDGYYILVALDRTRPLGRAFFESKKAVKRLMAEM